LHSPKTVWLDFGASNVAAFNVADFRRYAARLCRYENYIGKRGFNFNAAGQKTASQRYGVVKSRQIWDKSGVTLLNERNQSPQKNYTKKQSLKK
jgi:hypothetical protein